MEPYCGIARRHIDMRLTEYRPTCTPASGPRATRLLTATANFERHGRCWNHRGRTGLTHEGTCPWH